MGHPSFSSICIVVSLLLCSLVQLGRASKFHDAPDKVFQFLSRPEIHAPRWNITNHRPNLTSPGYWFLAPYESLSVHSEFNGFGWVGPHIYDGHGELVWSGSGEFDGANILDFRMNNVMGQDMITLGDRDQGTGIVLDEHFEIQDVVQMEEGKGQINGHEFYFVDNGTSLLFMKNHRKKATAEATKRVGFHGKGDCFVNFNSFVEVDAVTLEEKFVFDTFDHIDITESTYTDGGPDHFCLGGGLGWDFIHTNSVDKNEDGDYILSGRHTNTLYKISGKNGTVIWRLEGYQGKSDFKMADLKFSRQHHVRWRGRNETHRFISFLDNAWGDDQGQQPSHPHSRGLMVALDEKNMVATIEKEIDHPYGNGGFARKRGNMQFLDNGNIFMGWSNKAHHSEHTPDGEMIMDAVLQAEWLGSYRNYKFPFVGRPSTLPAMHPAAYGSDNGTVDTVVHVSWNGATEVERWNLYRTTSSGEHAQLVASAPKSGFETRIQYGGYASFVYVEAIDGDGVALGATDVQKTITHPNVTALAIEEEQAWLKEADADLAPLVFGSPTNMFVIGFAAGITVLAVAWLATHQGRAWAGRRRRRAARYDAVVESRFELGEDDEDETMVESSFYDKEDELRKPRVSADDGERATEKEKLLKGDVDVP